MNFTDRYLRQKNSDKFVADKRICYRGEHYYFEALLGKKSLGKFLLMLKFIKSNSEFTKVIRAFQKRNRALCRSAMQIGKSYTT